MTRRLLVLLLAAILASLASCRKEGEFRHARHVAATKGACDACHGKDPKAPRAATVDDCAACHKEARSLSRAEAARYGGEKTAAAPKPHGYADVKFSHAPHAGAGVSCATCHPADRRRGRTAVLPTMADCSACHEKEGVGRDCATCHETMRKTVRPPSHGSDWEVRHGSVSRPMDETCAICHDDRSCSACHATRKPRSHVGGWDKSAHGLRATEDRTSCTVCHEAGFCNRCHAVPPPSHRTANFRFGAHKTAARFNPRSCAVCHERPFCLACH